MASELPIRHITVQEPQWRELQKDVWSDRFVRATWSAGGKTNVARLRYRGGHTREYPKRSYEVAVGGKTFHYNAEYDDPSLIRNALSFRFFEGIGVPVPKTAHCLLYLNGINLGVYLEIEGVNREFFRKRRISVQSLFYAIDDRADFSGISRGGSRPKRSLYAGYRQIIGTAADRSKLIDFIQRLHTPKTVKIGTIHSYLERRLDIDNYLRWLAGAVLTGNYDGFDQNYALYRHAVKGCYRIIPWDYEGTWGRNCYGKLCGSGLVRVSGYNALTRQLLQNRSVRERYKRLMRKLLAGPFTLRKLSPVIDAMHESIRRDVLLDGRRKYTASEFAGEPNVIRTYIRERRRLVADALAKL